MADRVAVFNDGRIVQVASPQDIYERPRTRFVADFVGSSNVIEPVQTKAWAGIDKAASLRPEKIALLPDGASGSEGAVVVPGTIAQVLYHGAVNRVELALANGGRLLAAVPATSPVLPIQGASVRASFAREALHVMESA